MESKRTVRVALACDKCHMMSSFEINIGKPSFIGAPVGLMYIDGEEVMMCVDCCTQYLKENNILEVGVIAG